ncbi:MAG: DnaJ domain-containing protein [Sediminibacterium sp.]|jgi:molecular chaperone DnaJ|uniref:J domain-containing protein n=1 Tax=Sediminibacterium sp. TaxID=1917865 RepID=UPI002AB93D97|nr:DnaJ domain-containing protein [Sediminibacterium sp.]MDZ4071203.1 DnaJ domain-containing protein [Sediminibacterium sp.]
MSYKDYYQILRVLPNATTAEIKKSYRLLAMEFHPDKNPNAHAAEQFAFIKEAYAILSDPRQRKKYDATRFSKTYSNIRIATTPEEVRDMSKELVGRVQLMNPDRINRDKLVLDMDAVLSVYHIQLLEKWKDEKQNILLVKDLLYCMQYVDRSDCLRLTKIMHAIDGLSVEGQQQINQFLRSYQRNYYWEKYKILLALMMAILVCYLIYRL